MRRALGVDQHVDERPAPARDRLLQLGLVVDLVRERELDPALERLDDRARDRLEAVLEVERGQRRLEHRGEDVAVAARAGRHSSALGAGLVAQPLAEASSRETMAQLARETTCERIFAICPSSKSGKRS